MRPSMRLVSLSFAAVLAGVAGLVVPAEPATAGILPGGMVALSIHEGDGADGKVLKQVDLICDPVAGKHPKRHEACKALTAVSGDVQRLPGRTAACTRIYQPVTAVARGLWQGKWVVFEHHYGNSCELENALTPVFDF